MLLPFLSPILFVFLIIRFMYSAVELWPRSAIASDDDDDDDNVKCKYDVNITYDIKVLQALVV